MPVFGPAFLSAQQQQFEFARQMADQVLRQSELSRRKQEHEDELQFKKDEAERLGSQFQQGEDRRMQNEQMDNLRQSMDTGGHPLGVASTMAGFPEVPPAILAATRAQIEASRPMVDSVIPQFAPPGQAAQGPPGMGAPQQGGVGMLSGRAPVTDQNVLEYQSPKFQETQQEKASMQARRQAQTDMANQRFKLDTEKQQYKIEADAKKLEVDGIKFVSRMANDLRRLDETERHNHVTEKAATARIELSKVVHDQTAQARILAPWKDYAKDLRSQQTLLGQQIKSLESATRKADQARNLAEVEFRNLAADRQMKPTPEIIQRFNQVGDELRMQEDPNIPGSAAQLRQELGEAKTRYEQNRQLFNPDNPNALPQFRALNSKGTATKPKGGGSPTANLQQMSTADLVRRLAEKVPQ